MEKKFSDLLDGTIFFTTKFGKEIVCRKNRLWLTSSGFSNATIVDPDWEGELFVFFNDDEMVEVDGRKSGD